MQRQVKDLYFLDIAKKVSTQSTCVERQVGCVVIDKHNNILSTGYNGAPRGIEHCLISGCKKLAENNAACCPAVHAEQNALLQCSNVNKIWKIYITRSPCIHCVRMLLNTSCEYVLFSEIHKNPEPAALWFKKNYGGSWVCLETL